MAAHARHLQDANCGDTSQTL